MTAATTLNFGALLDLLNFDPAGEFVSLEYEAADGGWHTEVVTPLDAVVDFRLIPSTANVFHGVCPVKGPVRKNAGRGKEADVTRVSSLWCDLDVKPGGCPTIDVAKAIVANLSIKLGTRPTFIVYSGYGLHAYWVISDGQITDTAAARALIRRWGRLVKSVAGKLNVAVDSVYDLPRILRTPGSRNNKRSNGTASPLVTAERQPGTPLTIAEVEACLSAVGIDELPEDRNAVGSQQVSAPAGWKWAPATCGYMTKTIAEWEKETPPGRHPWLMSCYVRLACAHRQGCITEADYRRARRVVDERFDWLTRNTDPRRQPREYEISGAAHSALEWGIANTAAKTDAQTAAELGSHGHNKTAPPPLPPHDAFWTATPELQQIREWARARRVGPWGVLGVIMARVVATIRPTARIEAYTGHQGSLNVFVGLVAPSGYFKGATMGAGRDAAKIDYVYNTGPGSGEGINHVFAYYDKKTHKTEWKRHNVYLSVPEVDTLGNLDKRNGSTLLSQMCKAWSGEDLTFAYVDQTKALEIPAHSYRLCMVVGIQPGRAGTLLDATDSGVPQRFLWLPTDDPNILDKRTPTPAPLDCTEVANWAPIMDTRVEELTLPAKAVAEIDADLIAKHRGKGDPALDGHLMQCRIKTAIALHLIHPKPWGIVSDQMWDLSKTVMEVSQHTRDRVEAYRSAKTKQEDKRRAQREGTRGVIADDVKADAATKRVASSILRYLGRHGQTPRSDVRKGVANSRTRDYFDEAVERLIASGQVVLVSGTRGEILKPVNP